jgi:hypothetical protein
MWIILLILALYMTIDCVREAAQKRRIARRRRERDQERRIFEARYWRGG